MLRALELARRGEGLVEPNPMVGAVLVREGKVIGEGWHQRYGGPHAEVKAIEVVRKLGLHSTVGSTLYVTLEPCCHQGKTPPCSDLVIQSGIQRVVAALADPFPKVAGQGLVQLRQAGIEVEIGLHESEAKELLAPYLKKLSTGMPWVIAKWAMSLDGKIATHTGDSKWISSEASRKQVHELRGKVDAILVGIGTVLADDPMLTARPAGPRTALRVVLDSKLQLPVTSQLVMTAKETPVLVFHDASAPQEKRSELQQAGCECIDLTHRDVKQVLQELGKRNCTNLMVEGGSQILGSFWDANLMDEVHCYLAPKLIGGTAAKNPVGGKGLAKVSTESEWRTVESKVIDGDVWLRLRK